MVRVFRGKHIERSAAGFYVMQREDFARALTRYR
jgi:hypothetical protein